MMHVGYKNEDLRSDRFTSKTKYGCMCLMSNVNKTKPSKKTKTQAVMLSLKNMWGF